MSESPIWHPFTQHAVFPDSIFIDRAEGAYLYDRDGRPILDAISSWWVNIHGHNHPKIVAAADRNGYSPAALCEMVAEAAEENAGLRGYSRSERAVIKAGRLHGEDVVITRPRRRAH